MYELLSEIDGKWRKKELEKAQSALTGVEELQSNCKGRQGEQGRRERT